MVEKTVGEMRQDILDKLRKKKQESEMMTVLQMNDSEIRNLYYLIELREKGVYASC